MSLHVCELIRFCFRGLKESRGVCGNKKTCVDHVDVKVRMATVD